ncbi:MAG: gfo/Idh/MocA family oxidoreductase, partial [Chryseobacterium sp.]
MNTESSRRLFLKQALLASAAIAAPNLLMANGKWIGPADKVNIAFIGIGNRGAEIALELYKTGLANVVALCDVDMGAPQTLQILKQFPDVPRFQDFRQ